MSDELQDKIEEFFIKDEEEVLANKIEEMQGWFYLNDNTIGLSPELGDLPKKWRYLSYLLAAYVAALGGLRDSKSVPNGEVDDYFGWQGGGRSARHYAHSLEKYVTTSDEGREIPPGKFESAVEKIKQELNHE